MSSSLKQKQKKHTHRKTNHRKKEKQTVEKKNAKKGGNLPFLSSSEAKKNTKKKKW